MKAEGEWIAKESSVTVCTVLYCTVCKSKKINRKLECACMNRLLLHHDTVEVGSIVSDYLFTATVLVTT